MNTLASLPTEIVSLIVNHLESRRDLYMATLIHPAFYAAANKSLWKTIHLRHQAACLCFLNSLLRANCFAVRAICHLHLEDFLWDDNSIMIIMMRAPHLVSLTLDNATRITDTSLQHIAEFLPELCSLHLRSSPISHSSYRSLGQLPNLRLLVLLECSNLQQDTFSMYFSKSPLERLEIAPFVSDQDDTTDPFEVDATKFDLTALRNLSHLKLSEAPLDTLHHAHAVSTSLHRSCWPAMMSIELEGCFGMVDEEAVSLVQALPCGLTKLAITDGNFTNTTLDSIGVYQPQLIELDVSFNQQLTARGIRRFVRQCSSLSVIKLDYCNIDVIQFPEAQPQCWGTFVAFDSKFMALKQLDKHALDLIRRGLDVEDHDDDDDDDDESDVE